MTIQDDEGFEGVEFDAPVGSFRAGRSHEDDEYRAAIATNLSTQSWLKAKVGLAVLPMLNTFLCQ